MRLQRDRLLFRVTLESGKNQCGGKLAVRGYSDVAIPTWLSPTGPTVDSASAVAREQ